MTIFAIANTYVTWKRATTMLLDSVAVAASHAVDRQPPYALPPVVRVTGTPTGTVTVTGTVGGTPGTTEVVTFAGSAGFRPLTKRFSAISGVATSLTGATNIEIKARNPGGSATTMFTTIKTNWPVVLERPEGGAAFLDSEKQGRINRTDQVHLLVQYEEVWTPRVGDVVVISKTGETFEIQSVEETGEQPYHTTHWTCRVSLSQVRDNVG